MKVFKLAFWAIFFFGALLVFASLAGENQEAVSVTIFDYTSPEYQKWVVLVGSFFFGAIVATMFFVVQFIILETRYIRLKRAHKKLERALPKMAAESSIGAGASEISGPLSREPGLSSKSSTGSSQVEDV